MTSYFKDVDGGTEVKIFGIIILIYQVCKFSNSVKQMNTVGPAKRKILNNANFLNIFSE